MRHPLLTISAFAAAAAGVACVGGNSTTGPPGRSTAYAVLYGNVVTADTAFDLLVNGQGFVDSADAIAGTNAIGTFGPISLAGTTFYFEPVYVAQPEVLYFDIEGSAVIGQTEVADTVRAIRVRLDTLGGGPHDSLQVNLTLH